MQANDPEATDRSLTRGWRYRWQRLWAVVQETYEDEWWNIMFARPAAAIALLPIADIHFITPNLITAVDIPLMALFVFLLALGTPTTFLWAAVLILIIDVVDAMDGQLARYRHTSSYFGGFLDKTADLIFWSATFAVLGWVQMDRSGQMIYLFLGFSVGISLALRIYLYWVWLAEAAKTPEATIGTFIVKFIPPSAALEKRNPTPQPLRITQLKTHLMILAFSEGDLYFWIALFLFLNRPDILLWLVATTQAANTLIRLVQRGYNFHRLDLYRGGRIAQ